MSAGDWRGAMDEGNRDPLTLPLEKLQDHPILLLLDSSAIESGLIVRAMGSTLRIERALEEDWLDEAVEAKALTPMSRIQRYARLRRHARAAELVHELEQSFHAFRDQFRDQLTGPVDIDTKDCLILEDGIRLPYHPMSAAEAFRVKVAMERAYSAKEYQVVREVEP